MEFGFDPLQIETGLARNALHGEVFGEDGGDDAFEPFVAPDLHQAAQQFAAETVPLIRVADKNGELGLRRLVHFAQAPDCQNGALASSIIASVPMKPWRPSTGFSRESPGKGGKAERMERRDPRRGERRDDDSRLRHGGPSAGKRGHFEDRHRVLVREHYVEQFRGGSCPPGLAKKRNGCMPAGQAKKWQLGRALPREVIFYEVPQPLVVQIGAPPSGHRYGRVATDILMIAIGTGMVVDAIGDLGR